MYTIDSQSSPNAWYSIAIYKHSFNFGLIFCKRYKAVEEQSICVFYSSRKRAHQYFFSYPSQHST